MSRRLCLAVKILVALAVAACVAAAVVLWALSPGRLPPKGAPSEAQAQSFDRIEHGRYLATLGDCVACHTAPGGKPFAGGLPLATPFGTLLASNITPDPETGIGAWTDDEFVRAVREGVGRNGDLLYPGMPYTAYAKASRDDILAIRAYLATLEPVHEEVDANRLPFPFNQRKLLIGWNLLNFDAKPFTPDPQRSAEWNRGAYIVEGLGHCGSCHTAKNLLGGDKTGRALQGGVLQGWNAPDITGHPRTGLGGWSQEDVVAYLRTGANAHAIASGPMAEEIVNSSSKMTDGDLKAVAVYLKSLRADEKDDARPIAADDPRMRRGGAIYADNCSGCHYPAGGGAAHLFPALAGSPAVQSPDPTTLVRVVLSGARGVATGAAPTGPSMPPFAWRLGDEEVADVLTYLRNSWGNAAPAVAAGDVKTIRGLGRAGN